MDANDQVSDACACACACLVVFCLVGFLLLNSRNQPNIVVFFFVVVVVVVVVIKHRALQGKSNILFLILNRSDPIGVVYPIRSISSREEPKMAPPPSKPTTNDSTESI